jgi:hypothetical protein
MLSAERATRLADPVVIGRWAGAWRLGALALDPVGALDRYFAPLGGAIEITRTGSGPRRLLLMYDPQYNRQFLMNSKAMLTSGIWPLSAPPGSAQKNLRSHPLRSHGSEQANFNALIDPFLNRSTINQHFATIRAQVLAEVDHWRPGVHDFYRLARRCTETVAFSLLFGEHEQARFARFGDLLHEYHRAIWTPAAQAFPINLPGTPYHTALGRAEAVQRYIYEWMGAPDQREAPDFAFQRFAAARGADGCPFGQPRIAAAVAMLSWLSYAPPAGALSRARPLPAGPLVVDQADGVRVSAVRRGTAAVSGRLAGDDQHEGGAGGPARPLPPQHARRRAGRPDVRGGDHAQGRDADRVVATGSRRAERRRRGEGIDFRSLHAGAQPARAIVASKASRGTFA